MSQHAMIFDLDGTLFQTEKVAVPAFRRTFERLRRSGRYEGSLPTDEEIQSVFGLTHVEIWNRLLPGADEQTKQTADRWMLEEELHCLQQGMGALYPGVGETLHRLAREGWPLFIASNGILPYVKGVLTAFELLPLFSGIYTAGEYQTREKKDLVRILMNEHGVTGGYMVGDRSSDVEAGLANGLTVIGCRYAGFPNFSGESELDGAHVVIDSFPSLLNVIKSVSDQR
ncbi:MTA/SAH nucleosidase [Polycladomyces abyssicola]|uniref:MTA/SAH nucleosidase n=1 Tax=Polycladomyces abyssicola TaxID=1125966 RepID=A0A8D5UCT6_9BACL|nr:HAD hydrolase-like protein [Polycladomyces abyssicola]BCU80353.1 MTA/SAH nucleosidase [Polycladomyces abyssicola]